MMNNFANARQLFSLSESQNAVSTLAKQLNVVYSARSESDSPIIALTLLNGGVVFSGMLLPCLSFPLRLDSISVSRYRNKSSGSELQWHGYPTISLKGADVLLLDDIFDQGITLSMVKDWCVEQGANSVVSAVLAWKQLNQPLPEASNLRRPDYYALKVPDEFVVGLGMDAAGLYRNAPGIFVMGDKAE